MLPHVDTLPALGNLLAGSPAVLRPLTEVVNELILPVQAKTALERLGEAKLGDFLQDLNSHRVLKRTVPYKVVLKAFRNWAQTRVALAPPAPLKTVRELVAAAALPGFESWSVKFVDSEAVRYETIGRLPIAMSFNHARSSPRHRRLTEFVSRLEAARERDRAEPQLTAPSTGVSVLDAVRQRFASLRQEQRPLYPMRFFEGRGAFPPEGVQLRIQDTYTVSDTSMVVFGNSLEEVQQQRPRCSCGVSNCVHLAIALELLLEITARADSELSKALIRTLSAPWEKALAALSNLSSADAPVLTKAQTADASPGALVFEFSSSKVFVKFRKETKRGKAGKGKNIGRFTDYLHRVSGADRRVLELLALADADADDITSSRFFGDALLLLEGHPDVSWVDAPTPSPVSIRRAQVSFTQKEEGIHLEVVIGPGAEEASDYASSQGRVVPLLENNGIVLCIVSDEIEHLAATLKRHGATFPKEAVPTLTTMLPRLEAQATVELPDELKGDQVPSASRPLVRIESRGERFVLELRIEPLPEGAVFTPGHGVPVSATFDGRRRRYAHREFERELVEAARVVQTLGLDPTTSFEPFTWHLEPSDHTIETLRRLRHLAAQDVTVEWRSKEPRFTQEGGLDKLRLRINKTRDWFGIEGNLEIDDRRVSLAQLLEAARRRRRWVKVAENDYAELSESLLEKLSPLAHLADDGQTPMLSLGTMPLVDALEGQVAELDAAVEWRALTQRLANATTRRFHVPKALSAQLRDYQVDGFRWLSRLADWGAGACLADDMGLGKTLQGLTLLVSRGQLGPALVVAPASVLHTWHKEAGRFAPTLKVSLFHESDRDVSALGPNDVLVVSWSLLARAIEILASREWTTVIFDEAHAVKNSSTLRARAAQQIEAGFKVALSGTPVENHVGELWSLFRVVMPSLLGSEESFRRRFANSTPEALKALSVLVQPFILRRTKDQVATELPERTDLEIVVPLSPEERALYDDVRLSALADLHDGDIGEDKRFQVLAAMTRLRLTACHPKLVDAKWQGPTSKLTKLLELLKDLSASNHRVLVFSQFTQHLGLVSQACRDEGIAFSYLDGKVPVAERQRRVDLFQQGLGGDVFLISLKAGGTGLTLTAADYVIHLDPWWNPAVEDQASDRVHRIGQTRPVTVYRLIAEGTIEQQILSMHAEKRDLVDSLLAGTETAGKLSTEALAALIRSGGEA